jgi:hypothetical protein
MSNFETRAFPVTPIYNPYPVSCTQGMAFVTFWNTRDALKALREVIIVPGNRQLKVTIPFAKKTPGQVSASRNKAKLMTTQRKRGHEEIRLSVGGFPRPKQSKVEAQCTHFPGQLNESFFSTSHRLYQRHPNPKGVRLKKKNKCRIIVTIVWKAAKSYLVMEVNLPPPPHLPFPLRAFPFILSTPIHRSPPEVLAPWSISMLRLP